MKKFYLLSLPLLLSTTTSAQSLQVANFEGLLNEPESYWIGDTDNPDYTRGSFKSGSFTFSNLYNQQWGNWGFFGYANLTGNVFNSYTNTAEQLMNATGTAHSGSTYAVGYCDAYNGPTTVTLPDFAGKGTAVNGVWINNTAWVVSAILNGDGMSPAFSKGDYLMLTATAKNAEGDDTKADFYLADYRSENADEHFYVNDWKYFDLSALGDKVTEITFSMTTTKANQWGPTTPSYFAFDDLGAAAGSGVGTVAASDCKVVVEGHTITILSSDALTAGLYNLDGTKAATLRANQPAEIPAGLYLLPLPGETRRILVR